ncbi:hypothetical protein OROHE_003640 [Orobanche hederae]
MGLLGIALDEYDGYCVLTIADDVNGVSQFVRRDCVDYFEFTPVIKKVVINKPGIIGLDGVVPDELKNAFNDGVSLENAYMKLPKLPGEDTVTRQKEAVCRGIKDMNLGTGPSSSGELNVNDSMVVEK